MKRIIALLISLLLLSQTALASGEVMGTTDSATVDVSIFSDDTAVAFSELDINAPSAILIEKETGTVLYEKNADEVREPASVTKVMTILIIMELIESGQLSYEDMIPVSARASSMGGSQVYLAEGETMTLRDMLKSIVVSSANDAAVAVAEYISGSEDVFVSRMNARAKELGMTNTVFKNCTGLLDDREHVSTARDIAIMSRELIKHDSVKEFTTIWMDSIRDGKFGLSNTNKLIYYYDGATGLKTGFTQRSGYCLSATAMRDGVEYIAVVLGASTSTERFESAKTLLSCGFASYTLTSPVPDEPFSSVRVRLGTKSYVTPVLEDDTPAVIPKEKASSVTKTVELADELNAPVYEGDRIGTLTVKCGDEIIGEYPIISSESSEKLGFWNIYLNILKQILICSDMLLQKRE